MSAQLSDLGEFGLIEKISRGLPLSRSVMVGIGDDTAVIHPVPGKKILLTTDMLVEGVHFVADEDPRKIGHKSLAVSISDIAAMGGIPQSAVISIALPKNKDVKFVENLYAGMKKIAKEFHVDIVGGDTVRAKQFVINIALTGHVKPSHLVMRNGAKAGNKIFVTGPVGNSYKSGHHLTFTPRVEAAQFLVNRVKPTAMIDISDGLASDLGHILNASRVSAVLYEKNIPLRKGAKIANALSEGEDFELLFTLPPARAEKLRQMKHAFSFYEIGEIISQDEEPCMVDSRGKKQKLRLKGFSHF